ncbi:dipeptide epimerase [Flavobacterium gawalongense]|uniref:Dipeptide epimerase n=1 Tax=Flavobacterium gawalongense TaxID=2594432 RepID=A0A553BC11_9FLAO|nr:dipeptide epimerase [Flavobacterium gawalongense]TRW98079.1 dipeptide epimerase [Flavobacterium gawalongense]TRX02702.1 dipeptide epimerase [Flavobacterium gawalongense]TRX05779.1 dipeptide epimerase [Flavobacterium gawalongense]TRX06686.1 dipeptide epimerase [Flavobacterium gawalongense]TRX22430.1 dipeptide epimerase [Flavobacterium gawalongense]
MELILRKYNLKLKHTFTISRESIDFQPSLIVELKSEGFSGFGEATSNPYYRTTVPMMMLDLEKIRTLIEATTNETPEEFWVKIHPYLKDDMFALCALDMAYTDLYARKKGKKLYELWNYTINKNPLTDYTIGIASIEKMVSKMKELPWPIYKIKLGTKEDIAIIAALRKHTNAIFRIDANCGWGVEETINNAIELKKLGVEFLEQPMKADNWEGHKEVFKHSVLPIIADESCIIEEDVAKCHHYFHGVNVKLVKCGGLTPGRRMIQEAKKLGLKTMVGCMTESTVGISAIAHLLPQLDYVDMDGALLLAEDIATGVTIDFGKISYSEINGTGVTLI